MVMSSHLALEVVVVSVVHIFVRDFRGKSCQLCADQDHNFLVGRMEGEDVADELKSVGEFLLIAADKVSLSAANNLMIVY